MIEVNLLPGGKKRPSRAGLPLKLPSFKGVPGDPWLLGVAGVGTLVVLAVVYLFLATNGRHSELTEMVEAAAADSAQYHDLIDTMDRLRARRDSIAQRVEVIQGIDGGRYIWPHILDEVSTALPDYTWLTTLSQISGPPALRLQVIGQAGNNFALTQFMRNLEASAFLRGVNLISSEQVQEGSKLVHQFTLEVDWEDPPPEVIQSVPLFEEGAERSQGSVPERGT